MVGRFREIISEASPPRIRSPLDCGQFIGRPVFDEPTPAVRGSTLGIAKSRATRGGEHDGGL